MLGPEKVSILKLPTELEYLPNISKDLGIRLYIKRDDLTPLAMGGNKLRKLEYLLKDAQNQDVTMLLPLKLTVKRSTSVPLAAWAPTWGWRLPSNMKICHCI